MKIGNMKRQYKVFWVVYALLLLYVVADAIWERNEGMGHKHETVYDTIAVYDTIPYYHPVPRDSVVIRYVTATLPAAHDTGTDDGVPQEAVCDTTASDSARVVVPITQKVYETPDYRAYVSGYQAVLDSCFVRRQQWVVEPRPPDEPSRWGLSVGTGVSWTPEGMRPSMFVGVTYTFKRFRLSFYK